MKEEGFEDVPCNLCGSGNNYRVKLFQHKGSKKWQLVKCQNCGFVFHSPRLNEKIAVDAYDNKSPFADIIHSKLEIDEYLKRYLKEDVIQSFSKELDKIEKIKKSPGKILDIGSGPGTIVMLAKKRGWDGVGIDIASWCKEAGEKIGVDVLIGDINEGFLASESFDVCFSFSAIEHFYNPLKTMKEIYRCLKPGGVSVTSGMTNYNSIERKIGLKNYWKTSDPPAVVSYWTPQSMRFMHKKAGFLQNNINIECEWIQNKIIWSCLYPIKPLANKLLNKCGLGTSLRVVAMK